MSGNGFRANRLVEGGEDAILADAAQLMAARDEALGNQEVMVKIMVQVALQLTHPVSSLPSAEKMVFEVLDHVHHDGIGKTLGQVIRDGDPDEIRRLLTGK